VFPPKEETPPKRAIHKKGISKTLKNRRVEPIIN